MVKRRDDNNDTAETTQYAEWNDAEDPRAFEHGSADAVREGKLSAAQLPDGNGNVDPENPDAQYPPGVVDNSTAVLNTTDDAASFVPTRTVDQGTGSGDVAPTTTAATPDYS